MKLYKNMVFVMLFLLAGCGGGGGGSEAEPKILFFRISPEKAKSSLEVTFEWDTENTEGREIHELGLAVPPSGSQSIMIEKSGVYRLRAWKSGREIWSDPVQVEIEEEIPPPDPDPDPKPVCSDGLDNDGDGKIDLSDLGCTDAQDTDETDPVLPPPVDACTPNFGAMIAGGDSENYLLGRVVSHKTSKVVTYTKLAPGGTFSELYARISMDGGQVFSTPVLLESFSHLSTSQPVSHNLVVDSTGIIHLVWTRDFGGTFQVYHRRLSLSQEGGMVWDEAQDQIVPAGDYLGNSGILLSHGGDLYLLYNGGGNANRLWLTAMVNNTWQSPRVIRENNPLEKSGPSLWEGGVSSTGIISIAFREGVKATGEQFFVLSTLASSSSNLEEVVRIMTTSMSQIHSVAFGPQGEIFVVRGPNDGGTGLTLQKWSQGSWVVNTLTEDPGWPRQLLLVPSKGFGVLGYLRNYCSDTDGEGRKTLVTFSADGDTWGPPLVVQNIMKPVGGRFWDAIEVNVGDDGSIASYSRVVRSMTSSPSDLYINFLK